MKRNTLIDPVAFLQVHISRLFMERHSMTPETFLHLNSQKDILGFLRLGYEPFHLTGDDGVLEELDSYVYGDCFCQAKNGPLDIIETSATAKCEV